MVIFNFLQIWTILHYTTFRERKESCLCIKCQNVHLLLQGINTYRSTHNLSKHYSVTEFLNSEPPINSNNFPECNDTKESRYFIFEIKTESFTKNGKITEYSRTARVDKKEKVCEVVKKLLDRGESYLRYRFHVDNIAAVLPTIRESFPDKYIELDFSENLALKSNHEVQDDHFSGKQYSLHCSIVEPAWK